MFIIIVSILLDIFVEMQYHELYEVCVNDRRIATSTGTSKTICACCCDHRRVLIVGTPSNATGIPYYYN